MREQNGGSSNTSQVQVDPKSGRELFKPEINRNVAVKNRPASTRMVTENLHMKHKMIMDKRQKAADKEISLIK